MNPYEILGSLIQNGMGASSGRLNHSLGNEGLGGAGGFPGAWSGAGYGGGGGMPGAGGGMPGAGGGLFDILGKVLGGGNAAPSAAPSGGGFPGAGFPGSSGLPGGGGAGPAAAILKQVAGAILGGSGGSGSGASATGAGAMAVLAGLAAKALAASRASSAAAARPSAPQAQAQAESEDSLAAVLAGLRKAANPREETLVQDIAALTVRAMLNAAKADGRIDEGEAQRLVGKLQEDGLTAEDERFLREEIRKPMETDAIVRAARTPQVAAQVYAASVLAIEADTDVERRYLQDLAARLGLNQQTVAYVHRSLGMA